MQVRCHGGYSAEAPELRGHCMALGRRRRGGAGAYASTIAKASTKYRWSSWLVYDQNFRQESITVTKTGQQS